MPDRLMLAASSDPAALPGQWLIAGDPRALPRGWQSMALGDFHIAWNAPLPCTPLRADGGAAFGVILGWYIGSDGVLLGAVDGATTPEELEESLASLAGNFVLLAAVGDGWRLYLDACGSLSALYSPEQRCVSSNIFLIPGAASASSRTAGFDIPASDCMFPVGMTPRRDVERLLPNHYLDLASWKAVRHWPKGPVVPTPDVPRTVAEIGELLARNISAIARAVPIQMSLTAGRDSRMLLACARPWAKEASYFTYALPDRSGKLDVHVARRLAERLGLRHKVLPFLPPRQADARNWLYRTSASVGERRGLAAMRTTMQLDAERAYLPGLVAELARGYYWRLARGATAVEDRDALAKTLLVKGMNAPVNAQTVARVSTWIAGLPGAPGIYTLLDFLYLEQRLGCWAGTLSYAYADMLRFESWPLNSRRLVALMLSLPEDYKRASRLNDDVIRSRWPELAETPYNEGNLPFRLLDATVYYPVDLASRIRRRLRRTLRASASY